MSANGYQGPMLLEDFNDLADWAEALNRAYPRMKWVDELVEMSEAAELDRLV